MSDTKVTNSSKATEKPSDWVLWVTLLIVLLGALALGSLLVYAWPLAKQGDVGMYYGYAQAVWHGAVPYRDFALEYPPGVLPFIVLAWPLGAVAGGYLAGYLVLSMLVALIVLRHLYRQYGAKGVAAAAAIIIPVMPLFFYCLDIFAAAALYGALVLLRKSWRWAAVLLAAAVLIKGYPVVCLPVFLIVMPRARLWAFLRYFGATMAVAIMPFFLINPSGLWHSVTYHSGRPVQLESSLALVGYAEKLFGQPVHSFVSHKSFAIAFSGSGSVALVATILMAVSLAGLSYWLYRTTKSAEGRVQRPNLALGCLAALLIYILFFKVGSPQYIITIFAAGAIAVQQYSSRIRSALALRFFAISLAVYFSFVSYIGLVHLQAEAMIFVIIRYTLLVELLIWTLRKLRNTATKPEQKR